MTESVTLDVLAIGAHPDDVEITSGGLLIKLARMGRKVGVLDLAGGEMGTHGDESDRSREADRAAEIMGLSYRHNLGLPDSAIQYDHETKVKIARIIRETTPELVILPHWNQRHPDHLACSRLGFDACFLSGLKKLEATGEPHRPRKIIYASYFRNQDFSFLVDISDAFPQKVEAVAAYESQFGQMKKPDFASPETVNLAELIETDTRSVFSPGGLSVYDLMFTRAHALGQQANVQYAEAYTVKENILIDDPQKMPIRSI